MSVSISAAAPKPPRRLEEAGKRGEGVGREATARTLIARSQICTPSDGQHARDLRLGEQDCSGFVVGGPLELDPEPLGSAGIAPVGA